MNRRGFLAGILAAGVAPAIVRIGSLMPVRSIEIATDAECLAYCGMEAVGKLNAFDINEFVRRAFIPQLVASIYNTTPLQQRLLRVSA